MSETAVAGRSVLSQLVDARAALEQAARSYRRAVARCCDSLGAAEPLLDALELTSRLEEHGAKLLERLEASK